MSLAAAILIYLAAINLATFLAFADDKRRSERGEWRIPERSLLTYAAAGGSLGAVLGQQILRHKTRKEPFRTHLRLVLATQTVLIGALGFAPVRAVAAGVLRGALGL
jgi:uncharacterized membrane protein YsdA (DUF1294 family)